MDKEEIIRLAKEKKFTSKVLYNNPYKYSNNEDKRWLFWLTELKLWLSANYEIDVDVSTNDKEFVDFVKERNNWDLDRYYGVIYVKYKPLSGYRTQNNDYIKCLETGITHALKELI